MERHSFPMSELRIIAPAPPTTLHHPGSMVRLNSGGPVGVVEAVDADDHVSVLWLVAPSERSVLPMQCVSKVIG